jgi:hypothetical protein
VLVASAGVPQQLPLLLLTCWTLRSAPAHGGRRQKPARIYTNDVVATWVPRVYTLQVSLKVIIAHALARVLWRTIRMHRDAALLRVAGAPLHADDAVHYRHERAVAAVLIYRICCAVK